METTAMMEEEEVEEVMTFAETSFETCAVEGINAGSDIQMDLKQRIWVNMMESITLYSVTTFKIANAGGTTVGSFMQPKQRRIHTKEREDCLLI